LEQFLGSRWSSSRFEDTLGCFDYGVRDEADGIDAGLDEEFGHNRNQNVLAVGKSSSEAEERTAVLRSSRYSSSRLR